MNYKKVVFYEIFVERSALLELAPGIYLRYDNNQCCRSGSGFNGLPGSGDKDAGFPCSLDVLY
jgi:hypothetical protein